VCSSRAQNLLKAQLNNTQIHWRSVMSVLMNILYDIYTNKTYLEKCDECTDKELHCHTSP
jgi:hypothetical protein